MKYVESMIQEELQKIVTEDEQRQKEYDLHRALRAARMAELREALKLVSTPAEKAEEPETRYGKPYTDDEILQLVAYKEQGMSYSQIAKVMDRTTGSLSATYYFFKHGKQNKHTRVARRAGKISAEERQAIVDCYRKGLSVPQVAKRYGRDISTIRKIYKKLREGI
jgi:transposase